MSQKCNPGLCSCLFSLIHVLLFVGAIFGISKIEVSHLCDNCWVINFFKYPLGVFLIWFCIFCFLAMIGVIKRLLTKMHGRMTDKETDCVFPFETSDSLET